MRITPFSGGISAHASTLASVILDMGLYFKFFPSLDGFFHPLLLVLSSSRVYIFCQDIFFLRYTIC